MKVLEMEDDYAADYETDCQGVWGMLFGHRFEAVYDEAARFPSTFPRGDGERRTSGGGEEPHSHLSRPRLPPLRRGTQRARTQGERMNDETRAGERCTVRHSGASGSRRAMVVTESGTVYHVNVDRSAVPNGSQGRIRHFDSGPAFTWD